ncbi:hypothetical protein ACIRU3_26815 [Streptomyces sp. NPDC101151]|uniref:hypothetical protein n=1 Tax=Streptomyces sp. NPDC101151 TaxID=3366115 RepID=UPI00381ACBC2
MLRKEHAGYFHSSRATNGRTEALDAWRVTTDSQNVAQVMARQLGGDVHGIENSPDGRWEVLTESPAVEILVSEVADGVIAFTLLGEAGIGAFLFSSDMWNPEEISRMSVVGDSDFARCELRLMPIEFKTRTGLTILYILPSIELLASGV